MGYPVSYRKQLPGGVESRTPLGKKTGDSGDIGDKTPCLSPMSPMSPLFQGRGPREIFQAPKEGGYHSKLVNHGLAAGLSYNEACQEALRRVCQHDYLPGAIEYARRHSPDLYHRVVVELPARVHVSWEARMPPEEFRRLLDEWVEAFRLLCSAYPVC